MSFHWNPSATARAGLSEDDLVRLSSDETEARSDLDKDSVLRAWRANLTPEALTGQQIDAITERHPQLFRAKPSS